MGMFSHDEREAYRVDCYHTKDDFDNYSGERVEFIVPGPSGFNLHIMIPKPLFDYIKKIGG